MVATNDQFPLKKQTSPRGVGGIDISAGVYNEDYLQKLIGTNWAKEADKMRTQDSQIKMILAAVQNPIRSATWEFVASDAMDDQSILHRDFVEYILTCDMNRSWNVFINEALTMISFGHSVFEIIHKNVSNHRRFGSYTGIKSLSWRSPKTLEEWQLDRSTGELKGILQRSVGDFTNDVVIPAEFLLVFTIDQEGTYYSSASRAWLRPVYGNFLMKQFLRKLKGIGHEKMTIGTPKGIVPMEASEEDEAKFESMLQRYAANENQYLKLPQGYEIEILRGEFNSAGIEMAIEAENQEMVRAFMANFLNLGQGTSNSGGSYALGADLSDFFLKGIQYVADLICDKINSRLIPHIIDINFGEQESYPKLICSGVQDVGKEMSEIILNYVNAGAIEVDDTLRGFIRKLHKLPPEDLKEITDVEPEDNNPGEGEEDPTRGAPRTSGDNSPSSVSGPDPNNEQDVASDTQVTSDEFPVMALSSGRDNITKGAEGIKEVMALNLDFIANKLRADIVNRWKNLPEKSKSKATLKIKAGGGNAYKKELRQAYANLAGIAINQAEKEVGIGLTKFADPLDIASGITQARFPELPKSARDQIQSMIEQVVGAHLADLEKTAKFAATSSIGTTLDPEVLAKDIQDATNKQIDTLLASAPISQASELVNHVRLETFLSEESKKAGTIGLEFYNPDPVSEICKNLNGRIISIDNKEALRYYPPLHFNCKSEVRNVKLGSPKAKRIDDDLGWNIVASSPEEYNKIAKSVQFTDSQTLKILDDIQFSKTIQSLLFDREIYSQGQAVQWAAMRGFKTTDIDETDRYIAIRQYVPDEFIDGSLTKIEVAQGVKAVAGTLFISQQLPPEYEDQYREGFHDSLRPIFFSDEDELQAILFNKKNYSEKQAVQFAKNQKFKYTDVEDLGNKILLMQKDKKYFIEKTLRTVKIAMGLEAIVGKLKKDEKR